MAAAPAQVLKTKEEVGVFFADWQAKKMGRTGFHDLENCIKQLLEQDGEELLEHVTKDNQTKKEFCENWTDDKTHVLCGGLYTDLREFLGVDKGGAQAGGAAATAAAEVQNLEARLAALRLREEAIQQAEQAHQRRLRQEEEEARQRHQEARKQQFVNDSGLPAIKCGLGSTSRKPGPSKQTGGADNGLPNISTLTLNPLSFGVFDASAAVPLGPNAPISTWRLDAGKKPSKEWATESDIRKCVERVLDDAINAGSLPLMLYSEVQVLALRPDIWVVMHSGQPLGVVEVKIPSESNPPFAIDPSDNTDTVYHQITYYMMLLQNYFGLPVVFGLVSTYNEWRICWLGGEAADQLAQSTAPTAHAAHATVTSVATSPPDETRRVTRAAFKAAADATVAVVASPDTLNFRVPSMAEGDESVSNPASPVPPQQQIDVRIGVSKVFTFNDPQLPLILVTLMHKMASCATSPASITPALREDRYYVCYSDGAIEWRQLDKKFSSELQPMAMKKSAVNAVLYALCCLGQGGDGQAWLVRDYRGLLFVCKLPRMSALDLALCRSVDQEFSVWQTVHPELSSALLVQLRHFGPGKVPALIMPCFANVRAAQHRDPAIRAAVIEEIQRFAAQKIIHDDLKWRHVGLYKDIHGTLRAVFFDLARVMENVSEKDAVQQMSATLFNACDDGGCEDCEKCCV